MSFKIRTITCVLSAYSKGLRHTHRKDNTFSITILIIFAIMLINNKKYFPFYFHKGHMKFIISLCDYNVAFLLKAYKQYCLQWAILAQMALVNLLWREAQELTLGIFYVQDVGSCAPQTLSQLINSWFSCVCVFKLLLYFQCSLVKKRTVFLHSYSYAVFMGSSLKKNIF